MHAPLRLAAGFALVAMLAGTGTPLRAQTALDSAAILASARSQIGEANAAWVAGYRSRDAAAIAAAYGDSGIFVGADGAVVTGRAAVERMYVARMQRIASVQNGAVVQDGTTVLGPARIAEWGHAWLDFTPNGAGAQPRRTGGSYLTIWERQADGKWRIVRNLAFAP